ncbi:hypothetical protein EP7_001739 [Isosphaeraceae bacterium EP7]
MSEPPRKPPYPVTPDGRYFVVRGRLWRMADPSLTDDRRSSLQRDLMRARSALGRARKAGDDEARKAARLAIQAAKESLGERGSPWWTDGSPDQNRRMAVNTPYRDWYVAEAAGHDASPHS